MNRIRIIIPLCLLALGTFFIAGCSMSADGENKNSNKKEEDKAKEQAEEAVPVEIVEIGRGRIEGMVKSSTDLEAERSIPVFARTVNQVKEILAEEGDEVTQGQVLLIMEDDIQQTSAAKAKTQMLKAQQEYNRIKTLYDQALVSEQEFQNAELDLKQLQLAYEEAERELGYTVVEAPIAGTISRRNVHVGDFVGSRRDESALLFEIVDFNSLMAYVYLPEKHLPELKVNQKARVYAPSLGNDPVEGYVMRISPVVDPTTGTVKVAIGFKDVGRLRPGMYVNVELVTYVNKDAILVPKEALVYDADQIFVFRLIPGLDYPNRKVERVLIRPRLMDKFNVEPLEGIEEGDKLVVAGKTGLKDQALVRLPEDPKPEKDSEDKKSEK